MTDDAPLAITDATDGALASSGLDATYQARVDAAMAELGKGAPDEPPAPEGKAKGKPEDDEAKKPEADEKKPETPKEKVIHALKRKAERIARDRDDIKRDRAQLAAERAEAERIFAAKAEALSTEFAPLRAASEHLAKGDQDAAARALGLDASKWIQQSLKANTPEAKVEALQKAVETQQAELAAFKTREQAAQAAAQSQAAQAAAHKEFLALVRGGGDAFDTLAAFDDATLASYGDEMAERLAPACVGLSRPEFFARVARELEKHFSSQYAAIAARKGQSQNPTSDRGTEPSTSAHPVVPRARKPSPLDHRLAAEHSGHDRPTTDAERWAAAEKLL